jgi:hypothetical protein
MEAWAEKVQTGFLVLTCAVSIRGFATCSTRVRVKGMASYKKLMLAKIWSFSGEYFPSKVGNLIESHFKVPVGSGTFKNLSPIIGIDTFVFKLSSF